MHSNSLSSPLSGGVDAPVPLLLVTTRTGSPTASGRVARAGGWGLQFNATHRTDLGKNPLSNGGDWKAALLQRIRGLTFDMSGSQRRYRT